MHVNRGEYIEGGGFMEKGKSSLKKGRFRGVMEERGEFGEEIGVFVEKGGFRGFGGGKVGFLRVLGDKNGGMLKDLPYLGDVFGQNGGYLTGKCGKRGVECLELQRGQVVINNNNNKDWYIRNEKLVDTNTRSQIITEQ